MGKQTIYTRIERTTVLASTMPYSVSPKLVLQTSVMIVTLLVHLVVCVSVCCLCPVWALTVEYVDIQTSFLDCKYKHLHTI